MSGILEVDLLARRVDKLEDRIDELDSRIGGVERALTRLETMTWAVISLGAINAFISALLVYRLMG